MHVSGCLVIHFATSGGKKEYLIGKHQQKQMQSWCFCKVFNVTVHVAACHPLPNEDRNGKPAAIIMRYANHKYKSDVIKLSEKLKSSRVFLNDHLTKKKVDIALHARIL